MTVDELKKYLDEFDGDTEVEIVKADSLEVGNSKWVPLEGDSRDMVYMNLPKRRRVLQLGIMR